ncbi:MAG: hypothetical protein KDA60_01265 [Planctomycetales bacterium]|nr:hypothetical protein [Planctomycetales bacterium]
MSTLTDTTLNREQLAGLVDPRLCDLCDLCASAFPDWTDLVKRRVAETTEEGVLEFAEHTSSARPPANRAR